MSTLLLPPRPAAVRLILDSTGPVLGLTIPVRVSPPDTLIVLVRSDEPLAYVEASFTDAYGTAHPVGLVSPLDSPVTVRVPTEGISSGLGVFGLRAYDLAGNPSTLTRTVTIDRPRPWDLVATTVGAIDVATRVERVFEVEAETVHAYQVVTTTERDT